MYISKCAILCDCGCRKRSPWAATDEAAEALARQRGWSLDYGIARCRRCVERDRWPEVAVSCEMSTATPWVGGPEQVESESDPLAGLYEQQE